MSIMRPGVHTTISVPRLSSVICREINHKASLALFWLGAVPRWYKHVDIHRQTRSVQASVPEHEAGKPVQLFRPHNSDVLKNASHARKGADAAHLVGDAGAAVDAGAVEGQRLGEALGLLADLLHQLPCRRHYQRHRAIALPEEKLNVSA